jgi:hypothetical protein
MQASDECSDSADPVAHEPMSSGTLCVKRPDVAYDRNPTAALRERLSELIYPLGAGISPSCVLVLDLQRVQRTNIVADKLGGNQLWIWGLLGIWVCSRQCHCCNPRGMRANICISTIPWSTKRRSSNQTVTWKEPARADKQSSMDTHNPSSRAPALTDRIMNKPSLATIGSEVLSVNCPLVCATWFGTSACNNSLSNRPLTFRNPPRGPNHGESGGAVDSHLVRNLGMLQLIVQPAAWFGTPGGENHCESVVRLAVDFAHNHPCRGLCWRTPPQMAVHCERPSVGGWPKTTPCIIGPLLGG